MAPPPPYFAQTYSDTAQYTTMLPGMSSSNATTKSAVETVAVMAFLNSKLIGVLTPVTTPDREPLGRGVVQSIRKSNTQYMCDVVSPKNGVQLTAAIIFEGFIQDAPTQRRWGLSVSNQIGRKRVLESEEQLSTMMSRIGSDTESTAISPATRVDEPQSDLLPSGEKLDVLDLRSMTTSTQQVVIYKGSAYLSSGVPLNVRLEYQQ